MWPSATKKLDSPGLQYKTEQWKGMYRTKRISSEQQDTSGIWSGESKGMKFKPEEGAEGGSLGGREDGWSWRHFNFFNSIFLLGRVGEQPF